MFYYEKDYSSNVYYIKQGRKILQVCLTETIAKLTADKLNARYN